ncbi:MAG: hypothetical protein M1825_000036 [Sarcosagium campestre]|nr:MAG: hypothetical protein M1825_000036 [Sarcosagium campestre]
MKPLTSTSLRAFSSLLWVTLSLASPDPAAGPSKSTYLGCYSTSGSLKDQGYDTFQTDGKCQTDICFPKKKAVFALSDRSHCWCGESLPPPNLKVDNDKCGGKGAYMFYLTGIDGEDDVPVDDKDNASKTSTKSTSTKTASPSVVTVGGQTKTIVAPDAQNTGDSSANATTPSSGPNKAAIAAGVVVCVVVLGAIIIVAFFFLRRRKRRAVEEEYRRNAANDFLGKDSASSVSDSRLDPSVMMQRRQSDGSIADNQDYSRRILKVRRL